MKRLLVLVLGAVLALTSRVRADEDEPKVPAIQMGLQVVPLERLLPLGRMVCERLDIASRVKDPASATAVKLWLEHVGERGEKLKGIDLARPIAGYLAGEAISLAIPVTEERAFLDGLKGYGFDDPWKGPDATYTWVVPGYRAVMIAFRERYAHVATHPGNFGDWPASVKEALALAESHRTLCLVWRPDLPATAPASKSRGPNDWLANLFLNLILSQLSQIDRISFTCDLDARGRIIAEGSISARPGGSLARTFEESGRPVPSFAAMSMPGRNAFSAASAEDANAIQAIQKLLPTLEPAVGKKNVARFEKLLRTYAGSKPQAYLQANSSPGGGHSLLGCLHVSNGKQLDAEFRRIYQPILAEEPALRMNVVQSDQGAWIHAVDLPGPVAPRRQPATPTRTIYFGCGPQSLMFAMGQESLEILRRALDAPRPQQATQMMMQGSLSAIMDWHVSQSPELVKFQEAARSMRKVHDALFDKDEREFVQVSVAGGTSMTMRMQTNVSSAVFLVHHAPLLVTFYQVYSKEINASIADR